MAASDDPEFSYGDILDETSIKSKGTLKNILERAEWYLNLATDHEVELPDVPASIDA
jgi:hypothetical protein